MGMYYVSHSWRDTMIVPYVGFHSNIDVWNDKDERFVTSADGVVSKLISIEEQHICKLEKEIYELYKVSPWDYIKRWYGSFPNMDSLTLFVVKLQKME